MIKIVSALLVLAALVILAQDAPLKTCIHSTRGASFPIDPDRLAPNYARIATLKLEPPAELQPAVGPQEVHLPRCQFPETRDVFLSDPLPKILIGTTLYFVTADELKTLRPVARSAAFIVNSKSIIPGPDLGAYLAPPELLKLLRVASHPARVLIKSERHAVLESGFR